MFPNSAVLNIEFYNKINQCFVWYCEHSFSVSFLHSYSFLSLIFFSKLALMWGKCNIFNVSSSSYLAKTSSVHVRPWEAEKWNQSWTKAWWQWSFSSTIQATLVLRKLFIHGMLRTTCSLPKYIQFHNFFVLVYSGHPGVLSFLQYNESLW